MSLELLPCDWLLTSVSYISPDHFVGEYRTLLQHCIENESSTIENPTLTLKNDS